MDSRTANGNKAELRKDSRNLEERAGQLRNDYPG